MASAPKLKTLGVQWLYTKLKLALSVYWWHTNQNSCCLTTYNS